MKRFFTLILIVVGFTTLANAQFEELKCVGHYWLPTFELEGKEIKKKEVKAFLKRTCPSALSVFQKSRNKEITAYALATVGVSAICWDIDDVFEGNLRPSTYLGLALSTGAILFDFSSRRGYNQTIYTYENECRTVTPVSVNFGITPSNNVGFYVTF